MLQALDGLGITDQPTGTAIDDFTRFAFHLAVADRAMGREFEGHAAAIGGHFQYLGDHITRPLDAHRVARFHAQSGNFIMVVQSCARYHDAPDRDGFQICNRRQCPGATDLNGDFFNHCFRFFCGKFMRDGPAWRTADLT